MNRKRLIMIVIAVTALSPASTTVNADSKEQPPADQTAPAAEHIALAKYQGQWTVEFNFAHDNDVVYTGTSTNTMLVGDRFLQVQYEARNDTSMVEGVFMFGFDRRNDAYQILAMDSWGTYFVTASGKVSPEGDAFKCYGKDNDPHMKKLGYEKEFGYLTFFETENQFSITVFWVDTRTSERNEMKALEYRFSRAE